MNYKFNLYSIFCKKVPLLVKDKGLFSLIIPNSFSKEKYNFDIRKEYLFNMTIKSILDFSQYDGNVFENVLNDGYIVFVIQKGINNEDNIIINNYLKTKIYFSHIILQENMKKSFDYQFNYSQSFDIIKSIESKNIILLDKICFIRVGLTPSKPYKKFYGIDYENFKKKYTKNNKLYPYINANKNDCFCRKYLLKTNKNLIWNRELLYADKVCPGEEEDYTNEKLIFRNRGKELIGAFDNKKRLVSDIFNIIVLKCSYKKTRIDSFNDEDVLLSKNFDLKYILSIMNSKLMKYYLDNKFSYRDIKAPMLKIFPIYNISINEQKKIINVVDNIIKMQKSNDCLEDIDSQKKLKEYENQIDIMVYKLYELTYEEVLTIDKDFKLSKEDYNNLKPY